jgi:hypothetical protein
MIAVPSHSRVVQFGFVIPSEAWDLGVPIRAGARKVRIFKLHHYRTRREVVSCRNL